MENEKLLSYFNDYLEGRLDSEIRKEFINRLESDIEFYEEYRIKEGIKKIEMRRIIAELRLKSLKDNDLNDHLDIETGKSIHWISQWIKKKSIYILIGLLLLSLVYWLINESSIIPVKEKNEIIPENRMAPHIKDQNLEIKVDTMISSKNNSSKVAKKVIMANNLRNENILYDLAYIELDKYRDEDFSIDQYRSEQLNINTTDNRKMGLIHFVNGDYVLSAQSYQKVVNIEEYPNDYLKFGYSLIMIKELDNATKCFSAIIKNDLAEEWHARAKWYLFLISVLNEKSRNKDFKTAFYEYFAGENIDEDIKQRIINIK